MIVSFAAFSLIDILLEEEANSDVFSICRSAGDIEQAVANLLSSLRNLYRLGLRGVQLTGNGRNRLADGVAQRRTYKYV